MSDTCACGRLPDEGWIYWSDDTVLTRWDGEHRSSQCQIDQLVTAERPEQDVLLAEVETLRAQVEQLSDARHVPGPHFWHCPACRELHRVLGGAS